MAKHTAERLPRVAYLTGNYPAVSHTFILREIAMLRRLGFTVAACSIRQTPPAQLLGPEERAEAEQTFNVLNAARRPATLVAAQGAALRRPGRYLRALRLALTTGRPGLKGLVWQVFYFVEASVLARHLLQNRIDHLHNHFADSSANVAMLTSALSDIPISPTRCTARPKSTIRSAGTSRKRRRGRASSCASAISPAVPGDAVLRPRTLGRSSRSSIAA
jgi:hypothetical protein